METNVILKYRRECDSWLCSECDTENSMSLGKCTVCGCRKSSGDTILKAWTEADERYEMQSKKTPVTDTNAPIFRDADKHTRVPVEETNKNNVITGIIIVLILIIIGLLVAASQVSTYAAYSDTNKTVIECDYMAAMNYENNEIVVEGLK